MLRIKKFSIFKVTKHSFHNEFNRFLVYRIQNPTFSLRVRKIFIAIPQENIAPRTFLMMFFSNFFHLFPLPSFSTNLLFLSPVDDYDSKISNCYAFDEKDSMRYQLTDQNGYVFGFVPVPSSLPFSLFHCACGSR